MRYVICEDRMGGGVIFDGDLPEGLSVGDYFVQSMPTSPRAETTYEVTSRAVRVDTTGREPSMVYCDVIELDVNIIPIFV